MRFEWDDAKNQRNLAKHKVRFETAVLIFDDDYSLTQRDETTDEEERWITLGAIAPSAVLLVVHTCFEHAGEEVIRIISARAATRHERRAYEEAKQGAKKRHRRHRSYEG
jgi:uncharacterized DUF497 family protein